MFSITNQAIVEVLIIIKSTVLTVTIIVPCEIFAEEDEQSCSGYVPCKGSGYQLQTMTSCYIIGILDKDPAYYTASDACFNQHGGHLVAFNTPAEWETFRDVVLSRARGQLNWIVGLKTSSPHYPSLYVVFSHEHHITNPFLFVVPSGERQFYLPPFLLRWTASLA